MQETEYQLPEGSLYYKKQGRGIEITRYNGLAGRIVIPDDLPWSGEDKTKDGADGEMLPVKSIARKAFLSKKNLRSIVIPPSVEEVGDWAFAYCSALKSVEILSRETVFGRSVFLECAKLRELRIPEAPEAGSLLAAAVTQMESDYLLDLREAGTREWLEKWDARMLAILYAPDSEGYSRQILCGEEDYESADLETYLSRSRKKKVRLLLLRLLYPMELRSERRQELREYLLNHTKGRDTEETWEVVRTEYGDRREIYELFAKLGCLTKENAPDVIAQIGEEHPEMKAYFLKYQADHFGEKDFFADLEL